MNQSTLNKTFIAILLLFSFATVPTAFAFPGEAPPADAVESNYRGPSTQAAEDELKGYTTISDALPLYISENGPRMFRIGTGSRFVVTCETGISSDTANIGDPISVRLAHSVTYAGETVMPIGTILEGTVSLVDRSRHPLRADLPGKHWLNAQGALGLNFSKLEIRKLAIPIVAGPAPKTVISAVASSKFPMVADKKGDITVYYSAGKYAGLDLAIEGGSLAAGPFGLILGPALSGIAGAASPTYAYGHPEEEKGFKERSKGFFLGMVKGLPGGGLVTGAVEHGVDPVLVPGDKFIVELQQDLELQQ